MHAQHGITLNNWSEEEEERAVGKVDVEGDSAKGEEGGMEETRVVIECAEPYHIDLIHRHKVKS